MAATMRPLGLAMTARPGVRLETRAPAQPGYSAGLDGPIVLEGERHGRRVSITLPPLSGVRPVSETHVARGDGAGVLAEGALPAASGRRRGAAAPLQESLVKLAPSQRWTGVTASGGAGRHRLRAQGRRGGEWLLDLWLAERLADALGAKPVSSSS